MTTTGLLVNSIASTNGTTTITLAGEMDASTVDEVNAAVTTALADPDCRGLDINLAGTTFCDSTGLGALVAARNAAGQRSIELVLMQPSDQVRRVMHLTALDQVFTIRA